MSAPVACGASRQWEKSAFLAMKVLRFRSLPLRPGADAGSHSLTQCRAGALQPTATDYASLPTAHPILILSPFNTSHNNLSFIPVQVARTDPPALSFPRLSPCHRIAPFTPLDPFSFLSNNPCHRPALQLVPPNPHSAINPSSLPTVLTRQHPCRALCLLTSGLRTVVIGFDTESHGRLRTGVYWSKLENHNLSD